MSEISNQAIKEASTSAIPIPQEQFQAMLKDMLTCYEEKVLGRKARLQDMTIEELLRFIGFAMRFDSEVLSLIADELKRRGLSSGQFPSEAQDKIRAYKKKDRGLKFWRARLAK